MIPIVIAFCLTSMVASAPSDVRPIVDKVEARHIEAIVKPANGAWGYFNSHPVDAKGFPAQQGQFLNPATPGSRYFADHFPFNYPSYPQVNYDFGGKYETKSDSSTPEEDEEALRIFFGLFGGGNVAATATTTTTTSTTPSTTTSTTPAPVAATVAATAANPMANFMNKLVILNNLAIVKLMLANAGMMAMG